MKAIRIPPSRLGKKDFFSSFSDFAKVVCRKRARERIPVMRLIQKGKETGSRSQTVFVRVGKRMDQNKKRQEHKN